MKEETKTKYKTFFQVIKFGLVGVLNTLVDFAVLNFLMWMTETYSGSLIIIFNSISFSVAVINSYLWNKYWTFQDREKGVATQFAKFLVISVVGLFINTGIVYLGTTYVESLFGLSEGVWANVIKVIATGVAMFWNFIGYKLWAFREERSDKSES